MKNIVLVFMMLAAVVQAVPSFLMPDEAFKPKILKSSESQYDITVELGKNIYLYEDKLKISDPLLDDGIDFEVKKLTAAVMHHEEMAYLESPHFELKLHNSANVSGKKEVKVKLEFQGCSEQGLCYNPMEKEFVLSVDASQLLVKPSQLQADDALSETDLIANTFKNGNVFFILATFFGFGLLLAMTPCVFPMIPILSSIIVSQGPGMTAKRGFFLSLVYVLSMSVAYTLAGVLAGVFGSNIQAALQDPLVLSAFALIFVALALSMFGFYEIGIPHAWQTRLSKKSASAEKQGGVTGVAVMGFLSALIVGPCIAPPLAGALIYIGQSGDALLGGAALFVLSLGMGVPLLIIGTGAGKFMPRPGGWMTLVTKSFGVMMLAIAIWMLSRVIPAWSSMLLWAFLFIISSVYMGALERLRGDQHGFNALIKGVGVIFLIYGTFLFYGALSGATNPLSPLESRIAAAASTEVAQKNAATFTKIRSLEELKSEMAKAQGKRVLVDFYADWCTSCKELEHVTFKDAGVVAKMSGFVLLQADVTNNGNDEKALMKEFGIFGPPAILFFDEEGKKIKGKDIVGYKPPEEFLKLLNRI